jgi:type I restriction enzyme S subunit
MNDLISTNPTEISVASSWQILSIDALCERVTSGATPSRSESRYYQGGTIPWFKTKELGFLRLINSEEKITDAAIRETSAKLFPPGTVLMAMYGDGKTITSLGILEVEAATNQACCAMIPSAKICDSKFLYYSLSHYKQDFLQIANGGAQRNLSGALIKNFCIGAPPLLEQKAIAHILGTLDDKIELNRKNNETLEAMAKALFKSWFVDFDPVRAKAEGRPTGLPAEISDLFPDSFEDSELGVIPRGWEVGGLEEFLVLQRGFDLPAPQRIKGAYPVVAASGVSGTHNEPMAFAPGVVTGRSGVLGKVFYIQTDFYPLNTTLWAKEFRLATPIYGYFLLCDIDFAVFNAGSAVPTLNRNHLGSLRFPLPPKALVVSFTEIAVGLMKRKEGIVAETSNLSATRDALLPKLISGELRIPDAEKMLEEVGI